MFKFKTFSVSIVGYAFFALSILLLPQLSHAKDENLMRGKKVTIISSYRKYYSDVLVAIDNFEAIGVKVLMPLKSKPINPGAEFIKFEGDEKKTARQIEDDFLASIKEADFVYVLNKDGYIGFSGAIEMGYALALKKPIYCAVKLTDGGFPHACSKVLPVDRIKS